MKTLRLLILLFFTHFVISQTEGLKDSTIKVQDSVTIKEYIIEEVTVTDEFETKLTKEEKDQIKLLHRRVLVVYPYAKLTADRLVQLNTTLDKLKSEREKKKYFKIVEKYLNEEFEPRLKKLSTKQGQILIKLINRQTGETAFNLIKKHKNGWKAFWSNNTASLFNIDLKREYKPTTVPEDYYIETFLNKCFEEGKLNKQEAAKPISEWELNAIWNEANRKRKQETLNR